MLLLYIILFACCICLIYLHFNVFERSNTTFRYFLNFPHPQKVIQLIYIYIYIFRISLFKCINICSCFFYLYFSLLFLFLYLLFLFTLVTSLKRTLYFFNHNQAHNAEITSATEALLRVAVPSVAHELYYCSLAELIGDKSHPFKITRLVTC